MAGIVGLTEIQHQNGTSAMTINSSGQVAFSNKKISFVLVYAQGSDGYNTISTGSYLPLNAVYQSKGTGAADYNTTTYKYTAPVNGIYNISLAGITNGTSSHWNLDIDGTEQYTFTWSASREYNSTINHYLNAGEVVGFKSGNTSGYYRNSASLPSSLHYTYASFHLAEEIVG